MINYTLVKRCAVFIVAQLIMAIGVSLSVKANLGVSPISCVPYVYSLTTSLSLGELTILMNIVFIFLQILILRKKYQIAQLIQLPSIITFGYFIDFTMLLVAHITPELYWQQLLLSLFACVVLAFGIFLMLKSKLTYLPLDGLSVAIAQTFHIEFGKIKISVDTLMVTIGAISSFAFLYRLEGIREGSLIAALLVGTLIKFYNHKIQGIEAWIEPKGIETPRVNETILDSLVITISREYGSGGHEIGQYIAKALNIPFYDKNLINLTAEQTGYTAEYIQEHEQRLSSELFYELYEQSYAYIDDELPPSDVLFLVQSKIIRDLCAKGPCVIVGRCANYVLKENVHCINIFIHANPTYRLNKINNEYNVSPALTYEEIHDADKKRANYSLHYTGQEWHDVTQYHLSIDSSLYGSQRAAQKIIEFIKDIKE